MEPQPQTRTKRPKAPSEEPQVKDEHYDVPAKRLKTNNETPASPTSSSAGTPTPSASSLPLPPHLTREALLSSASKVKSRRVSTRLQKMNSRANDPFTVLPDNVVEAIIRSLNPQDNARIRGVCRLWKAQVEYCISPGYVSKLFSSRKSLEGANREDPMWAEKFYRKQCMSKCSTSSFKNAIVTIGLLPFLSFWF